VIAGPLYTTQGLGVSQTGLTRPHHPVYHRAGFVRWQLPQTHELGWAAGAFLYACEVLSG